MNQFCRPAYLDEAKDSPTQRVRCPVHGFIHYSENEQKIIDHPYFRRLRHIRQLALTEYVYPGATHSRFEHSLGVMELATRFFDGLIARQGKTIEAKFKEIPEFEDGPLIKARQAVRLAALLHDVGHPPFSHVAEKHIEKLIGTDHEKIGIKIINSEFLQDGDMVQTEVEGMRRILNETFWEGCAQAVADIIAKKMKSHLRILTSLISSDMDADRTDYLRRDSLHCGVDYGRFDHNRLVECLTVCEDDFETLEIGIDQSGIHTFEALILARYQMNTQVYFHRIRRIYDRYLNEYVKALPADTLNSIPKVLALNDISMLHRIQEDARHGEGDRRKWAARIYERNHHRLVHETGVAAHDLDLRCSKKLFECLQERFPSVEFIHDTAETNVHKIFIPDKDRDISEWVELKVIGNDRKSRQVGIESQVLSSIPKQFKCPRIFADYSTRDKNQIKEIREYATRQWKDLGGR